MPEEARKRSPRSSRLLDADALWSYALKILGQRALSVGEVRQRLGRKAANHADVDPILSRLGENGYLNDNRMAESFATTRRDVRGFGKFRVLRDLAQRRVAPSVARQAVEQAFEGVDEEKSIEEFLERKYRGVSLAAYLAEEKHLASTYRRLRTAGFTSGATIRVLKRHAARAGELEDIEPEQ